MNDETKNPQGAGAPENPTADAAGGGHPAEGPADVPAPAAPPAAGPYPPAEGDHGPTPAEEPVTDAQPRRRKKLLVRIGAVAGVIVVLLAIAAFANRPSVLEKAADACDSPLWAVVMDDGDSIALDMKGGEDIIGMEISEIVCILDELGTPQSVVSRMDSTRALDGMQTAEWDGLTASWNYHPDNGLDIIVSRD